MTSTRAWVRAATALVAFVLIFAVIIAVSASQPRAHLYLLPFPPSEISMAHEGEAEPTQRGYFGAWTNGPPTDPDFFPIGVWLQQPTAQRNGVSNAQNYRNLGMNIIVNTPGPVTPADLAALPAGMYLMPGSVSEITKSSEKVIGYAAIDEPDLAGGGRGCVTPHALRGVVDKIRSADPTRPIWVNFGPGMALPYFAQQAPGCPRPWPGIAAWIASGQTGDFLPNYDYRTYYQWASVPDIVSVDHYATADYRQPGPNQQLWGYGRMTRRALMFAAGKPVWAYVQVANVNGPDEVARTPTPEQVRVMVWMALVNGATGIEYFVHSFNPWLEDALLVNAAMSEMVKRVNAEIASLAPVLNSATLTDAVVLSQTSSPVRYLTKSLGGSIYVFAIEDRGAPTPATFTLTGQTEGSVTVIGEDRTASLVDGAFTDTFAPYGIHLYRIDPP